MDIRLLHVPWQSPYPPPSPLGKRAAPSAQNGCRSLLMILTTTWPGLHNQGKAVSVPNVLGGLSALVPSPPTHPRSVETQGGGGCGSALQ